jgi:predicted O-methyltransferase YrrM
MSQPVWDEVDRYVEDHLVAREPAMDRIRQVSDAEGLPAIAVSPAQGKMLYLLARALGAKRVLEIGTLGGYSTAWLARAVPEGGAVVSLEIDPHHAEVARANLDQAGLGAQVEIKVGPALDSLAALACDPGPPFDLVFIDADKVNNAAYVRAVLPLVRLGAVVIVDNVVRQGKIVDPGNSEEAVTGTRRMFEALTELAELDATAVQTVGSKGYDGFVLAVVRDPSTGR